MKLFEGKGKGSAKVGKEKGEDIQGPKMFQRQTKPGINIVDKRLPAGAPSRIAEAEKTWGRVEGLRPVGGPKIMKQTGFKKVFGDEGNTRQKMPDAKTKSFSIAKKKADEKKKAPEREAEEGETVKGRVWWRLSGPKEAKPEKEAKKATELEPVMSEVASLKDEELVSLLISVSGGIFGSSKKKLEKTVMKKLGVAENEALKRGTLLAYSRQPDVAKKLRKALEKREKLAAKALILEEKRKKAEAKILAKTEKKREELRKKLIEKRTRIEVEGAKRIRKALDKKIAKGLEITEADLQMPTAPGPEIAEHMARLQMLLREQEMYEETSKQKKLKKVKGVGKPFRFVGKAINRTIGRINHAVFVLFSTLLAVPIDLVRLLARGVGALLASIYKRVGHISPFGWKRKINQLIIYSGIAKTQEEITGITIVNGVILAVLVVAIGFFLFNSDILQLLALGIISFIAVWVIVYSVLNLLADKRSDEVEATLPDVLQIVSGNISAGMTPYNALWVSARKEFGALAEEIKIAQKETLGGKPFQNALRDMGTRVRSNVLQRTLRLINQGMKAGGELPEILQGIGRDIRQMRLLQKQMAANTMSYVMFILFGMLLGAPLLFSVSIQFVDVMNKFQPEEMNVGDMKAAHSSPSMGLQNINTISVRGGGCPKDTDGDGIPDKWEKSYGLNPKNNTDASSVDPQTGKTYTEIYQKTAEPVPASCITSDYLSIFAMLALTSIAFFGSILIGLIKEGKQSVGVKLIPLLILATLGMFFLMRWALSLVFGSILTI